jgi:outer membrane protein OmpA-like peptidoglycan-associated protein
MLRRSAALALASLPLLPAAAIADRGIDAQIHKPAMDPYGIFTVERAVGPRQYDFGFRFGANFAAAPLKLDTTGDLGVPDGSTDDVFESQLTLDLGLSFGVTDWLTMAIDVPIQRQPLASGYGDVGMYNPTADPPDVGTGFYSARPDQNIDPSETHPGDPRVALKVRILDGKLKLAGQVTAFVPFGDEDVFAGSEGFVLEPKVIFDYPIGDKGFLAVNAGARIREGVLAVTRPVNAMGELMDGPDTPIIFVGTEALVAVGAKFEVLPRVALGGEVYGLVPILTSDECTGDCKNGDLTGDAVVGAWFQTTHDSWISVGAGLGVVPDAARSESFRVVASFSWAPTPEGARTGGGGDRDNDNIADGPDVCPDEPEDADGFQDDDGCPELDNDLDGVLDAQDKCESEPEDRDGFDDEDGCPEGDDDKDGIEDLNDRCPQEAEDKDGYADDDGCPDEDNDGDGILDGKDKCPEEAETVNGVDDLDGCPDQAVQGGPKLATDRIDLQGERIDFQGKTAKLTRASENTLDGVAAVLKANPDVRVRIEVGVEASGTKRADKDRDRKLTQDRANAIQTLLLGKGVKPQQLDVAPLGSDFPIDAKNPKDPKLNRRVEFIRVTQ